MELSARRLCSRIELRPLDESSIGMYLKAMFSVSEMDEAISGGLWKRTGGNPLFLVHLTNFLIRQNALVEKQGRLTLGEGLDLEDYGVPDDLRELINEQIERLAGEDLAALESGSVAGSEFSCATVAAGIEKSEEAIEERFQNLAKHRQFVEELGEEHGVDGAASRRFRFKHVLFRDVVYDRIAEARRARIHRNIGEHREGVYGDRADSIASELATHFEAGNDPLRTIEFYGLAGESALRRNATNEAVRHFEEALGLLSRVENENKREELELYYCMAIGTTRMCSEGHTSPAVKEYYERAVKIAERLNLSEELHLSYYGLHMYHFVSANHQEALHLGRQCLANARKTNNARLITEAYTAIGNVHTLCGDFLLAGEELEAGLAAFDEDASEVTLFHSVHDSRMVCLSYLSRVHWYLGNADKALKLSERCIEIGRSLRHPHSLCFALFFSVIVLFRRGEFESALARAAETVDYADEYQFPIWSNLGRIFQGVVSVHLGDKEWGIALIRRGIEARSQSGAHVGTCQTLCLLIEALIVSGQYEEGLERVNEALELVEESREHGYEAELVRQKGELLLKSGKRTSGGENAEKLFRKAMLIAHRQQAYGWELRAATSLAKLLRDEGKPTDALSVIDEVYDRMNEGHSTRDAVIAQNLISELGGSIRLSPENKPQSNQEQNDRSVSAAAEGKDPNTYRFQLKGDFWSVNFKNETCHIQSTRGMEYLSLILSRPNEEIHALRLVQGNVEEPATPTSLLEELPAQHLSDAGDLLDSRAKNEYRNRLTELREELEEARAFNDEGRIEVVEEEIEAISKALSSAIGLGGRSRKAGSPSERARVNVTRAIKTALKRITEAHPAAGDHLIRTVKTGNFCSYNPDPLARIIWKTS